MNYLKKARKPFSSLILKAFLASLITGLFIISAHADDMSHVQALKLELAMPDNLYEQATQAMEYMQTTDYDLCKGSIANTQHIMSMQLAAKF